MTGVDQALNPVSGAVPVFASATELASMLRSGRLSSSDLLEAYLARIERYDRSLNAVVAFDLDRARAEAKAADEAQSRGELFGPLHGLPMTVKEQFATVGLGRTFGTPRLAKETSTSDSAPVTRLRQAGAVIFGKTNMAEFGQDVQTHNPLFGTTNNPWDLERTCGGSSGGSAVAVATALSALELGSDIGGSIRMPAHCCGVYGHKPSYGVVADPQDESREPGFQVELDLVAAGPLARSADDLILALEVLAGPEPAQAAAWRLELPPARHSALNDYRVGAWLDDPDCPTEPEVLQPLRRTVAALRESGVSVNEAARPAIRLREAFREYQRLLYGAICHGIPVVANLANSRFLAGLPQMIPGDGQLARVVRAAGATHAQWILANEARQRYRQIWAEFFQDFDVLLCPPSPVAAIRHDHRFGSLIFFRTIRTANGRRSYMDQFVWAGVTGMAFLPVTTAPVGHTQEGLPVGVQIVGPYLEDLTTIDFARRLQGVLGGFERPPGFM